MSSNTETPSRGHAGPRVAAAIKDLIGLPLLGWPRLALRDACSVPLWESDHSLRRDLLATPDCLLFHAELCIEQETQAEGYLHSRLSTPPASIVYFGQVWSSASIRVPGVRHSHPKGPFLCSWSPCLHISADIHAECACVFGLGRISLPLSIRPTVSTLPPLPVSILSHSRPNCSSSLAAPNRQAGRQQASPSTGDRVAGDRVSNTQASQQVRGQLPLALHLLDEEAP